MRLVMRHSLDIGQCKHRPEFIHPLWIDIFIKPSIPTSLCGNFGKDNVSGDTSIDMLVGNE